MFVRLTVISVNDIKLTLSLLLCLQIQGELVHFFTSDI